MVGKGLATRDSLVIEMHYKGGLALEAQPGAEAAKLLGFEHVVGWSEMETFFSGRAAQAPVLYFAGAEFGSPELPSNLLSSTSPAAPIWLQPILQEWPTFEAKDATKRIERLMDIQNAEEIACLTSGGESDGPRIAGRDACHSAKRLATQRGSCGRKHLLERRCPWNVWLGVGDGRRERSNSAAFLFPGAVRSPKPHHASRRTADVGCLVAARS